MAALTGSYMPGTAQTDGSFTVTMTASGTQRYDSTVMVSKGGDASAIYTQWLALCQTQDDAYDAAVAAAVTVSKTPREFLGLFTATEYCALKDSTVADVRQIVGIFESAQYITKTDPSYAPSMSVLVSEGILTQARSDAITGSF
jgi:hypothetical protein